VNWIKVSDPKSLGSWGKETSEYLTRVGKSELLMLHDLSEFESLILITTWGHALNEGAQVHVHVDLHVSVGVRLNSRIVFSLKGLPCLGMYEDSNAPVFEC